MRRRTITPPVYILAAGVDLEGRLIEMLAVELDDDQGILIFHAMRLTSKAASLGESRSAYIRAVIEQALMQ